MSDWLSPNPPDITDTLPAIRMIKTAEEFKKLRSSENLDEQRRAGVDEASIETWKEVISKYPQLKEWVIYNKTVPLEILKQLSTDPNPIVRSEVARKRKIDSEIFGRLKDDKDENVKLSLFYNTKLTKEQKNKIDTNGSIWFQRQIFQKTKTASDSEKEIELFGYNKYWIELGIVTEEQIVKDIEEFKKGDDSDPDHYRHKRLTNWLSNKKEIKDFELDQVCKLHRNDIDSSYANSVVVGFHGLKFLNEQNKILFEQRIEGLSPFLKSFVQNERIKRKIETDEISKEEIELLLENKNNSLLRFLSEISNRIDVLKVLKNYQGSKKIRNVAEQRMKKAGNKR